MNRARLPAGAGTALALVLGFHLRSALPPAVFVGGGMGGLLLALIRGRPRTASAARSLVAVFLLGAAAGGLRGKTLRPLPSRDRATVAGEVVGWERGRTAVFARIAVRRFEGRTLHPPRPVRVIADTSWGTVPRARWLAVTGRVEGARMGTVPGARRPDVAATLLAERGAAPRWGPGTGPAIHRARERLLQVLDRRFRGFPRRFAEAVLLGRGHALTDEERGWFRRTGTSHLVAVSGLHVGLAALFVTLLLSGAPLRARLLGRSLAAWGYAALAAGAPSALRAAAVVSAASVGTLLGRTRHGAAWLALAVPWLLWFDPGLAGGLSFRLSLGAVLGILLALELAGTGARRRLIAAVATSLGAQWGTLPASVAAFGTAAPAALLVNLLVVPLAGLYLPALACSLVAGALGWGGEPFATAAGGLAGLLRSVIRFGSDHLPTLTALPAPPGFIEPLGILLPVVWLSMPLQARRNPRWRLAGGAAALGVLAATLIAVPPPRGPWVAFLDVGQGDAAVYRARTGGVWVVDVGDDRGPGDAVRNALDPFLRHRRIRTIEGLVLSHRHRDHVGALASLLDGRRVRKVYDAGIGPPGGTSGAVDSLLDAHELWPCLVAAGDTLVAGPSLRVTVAGPPRPRRGEGTTPHTLNDASLILRIEDGSLSVLFAGDAERWGEESAVNGPGPLGARILKIGHHGSDTSSGDRFLEAVSPAWAIVSVGEGNPFGHPSVEVLRRLAARGVRIHRTDRDGSAIFRMAGDSVIYRRFPPLAGGPGTLSP